MSDLQAGFRFPADVSRETLERLNIYATRLKLWNKAINLVSPKSIDDLWTRHFADSAQICELIPSGAKHIVDLGSGAGFPGAVAALLLEDKTGDRTFTLIESDQRKAAFLREISRETGVKFNVLCARIEETAPLGADVLTARALAPLRSLLGFAKRHGKAGATAIFLKGVNAKKEIAEALEFWTFDCETYPSRTDPEAVVLSIGDIERV